MPDQKPERTVSLLKQRKPPVSEELVTLLKAALADAESGAMHEAVLVFATFDGSTGFTRTTIGYIVPILGEMTMAIHTLASEGTEENQAV